MSSFYSLRKSRRILTTANTLYRKKGGKLPENERMALESHLFKLDAALLEKKREEADAQARQVETLSSKYFKKSFFEYLLEFAFALLLALVVATLVRQMWFELYEIPTGSMRPTFKEKDHLTVSKLTFGINVPLQVRHFYFDPTLVQRTSVLIFSGENIPGIDSDTTYFWVIPYKKRYIKRSIGKPGDSLYFYGGKIYGVDADGHPLEELLDSPWMHDLEHIPFLNFEGKTSVPSASQILFRQMNQNIGRLSVAPSGNLMGEIFNGKEWVKDNPNAANRSHNNLQTYSDFWGMRNFAMARLLTKPQVQKIHPQFSLEGLEEGVMYLEFRHNPSLTYPKPHLFSRRQGFGLQLVPQVTLLPLQQEQLNTLMDHMYTARFVVSNGYARRYSVEENINSAGAPHFPHVPDGTYEFYFGKASKIGWGGITSALPLDHPLYERTPENIQKLFNLGIEMDTAFIPTSSEQLYFPNRYAYFREGDLYLLGAPLLKKEDPLLISFQAREEDRVKQSTPQRPYVAFKDNGPPLKEDGSLDIEFIRIFGITLPPEKYLVLGDNHAMSLDSRVFGFVPQQNLQGAPSLIIWPPGDRWGPPEQKPYPIFTLPRLIVWTFVGIITLIWYFFHRRSLRKPLFKKIT
jgi:signal peptidase I